MHPAASGVDYIKRDLFFIILKKRKKIPDRSYEVTQDEKEYYSHYLSSS